METGREKIKKKNINYSKNNKGNKSQMWPDVVMSHKNKSCLKKFNKKLMWFKASINPKFKICSKKSNKINKKYKMHKKEDNKPQKINGWKKVKKNDIKYFTL